MSRRTAALVHCLARLGLLGLICLGFAPTASAHDPSLSWQTLETEHFRVHFHDGLEPLARKAARYAEAALARLTPMLDHRMDSPVHIVLSDETDSANGNASSSLRPVINLFAAYPDARSELNDYDDYLWNLIVHELTHTVHLDTAGGIPALFNTIFGKQWLPNESQPSWFKEGLAVYSESTFSSGGRNRSSIYDMFLRAEVLEGTFFDLADTSGAPTVWPFGTIAYLHGSRFLQWVADREGESILPRLSHQYGSQVVPYALNFAAHEVMGTTWIALYPQWRAAVTKEVDEKAARLRAQGLTETRRLSRSGLYTGEPRFHGATLYYIADSDRSRPTLRAIESDGSEREVATLLTTGALAIASNGRFAIISQTVPVETYRSGTDLFRVDLATGERTQLTFGARLDEPDIAPSHRSLVAVQRLTGGGSRLTRLPVDGGLPKTLYEAPEDCHLFTPRFSPDESHIAFSLQCPGGRDIVQLDLATKALEYLTRDRALDLDPAYDPSGRYILFSSDRSRLYNLYAYDTVTHTTSQVTQVLDGAFRPAVSEGSSAAAPRIAYVAYSTRGFDVATLPFDPTSWRAPSPSESPPPRPAPPPLAIEPLEALTLSPYHSWETILPLYWSPIWTSDPKGNVLGVATSGSDVVGLVDWTLQATYGLDSRAPGLDFTLHTEAFRPEFTFTASTHIFSQSYAPHGEVERQTALGLTASLPFNRLDQRWRLSLGYRWRDFDPATVLLPVVPDGPMPRRLERGQLSSIVLGASFSNVEQYAQDISPSRGVSLKAALQSARAAWGSDFDVDVLTADGTGYLAMPWFRNHVLALHLGGGFGAGDLGGRERFYLGGIGQQNIFLDAFNMTGVYGPSLRGYPIDALRGGHYLLANAEYRFPIARLDTGPWTLPLYLRRLHGAVTFDAGSVESPFRAGAIHPSAGVELRTELLLGYAFSTQLRLGYARGMGRGGIDELFFTLGNSF